MVDPKTDSARDEDRAGFQLIRAEVFNWGTFHKRVWSLELAGNNGLLTGDIGSGKSTLVDALTTLFVPQQKIVYNRAAGADARERTPYSYVRGEYKSEKDDYSQSGKAVALREKNSYSVLLAAFHNTALQEFVCVAQVFWVRANRRTPEKFFVVARRKLNVSEDFSGFGDNILNLKKRLRKLEAVEVFDTFKDYAGRFRQLLGIKSEQALNLFYQTVSMKSVGNLTAFVREHMLEEYEVQSRIEGLSRNFDNLNQAHATILKARDQIRLLRPLRRGQRRFAGLSRVSGGLTEGRDAIEPCFASIQIDLLRELLTRLGNESDRLGMRIDSVKEKLANLRLRAQNLRDSIEKEGGGRIRQIDQELEHLQRDLRRKQDHRDRYLKLVRALELDVADSADAFLENQRQGRALAEKTDADVEELQSALVERGVDARKLQKDGASIQAEIDSLKDRRNNIPRQSLQIREEMAHALGVAEDRLPFIGELLRVSETEKDWEGTLERVLHNFGLSLLVPEDLYPLVSKYVDRTHLRGRLVYFHARVDEKYPFRGPATPGTLISKLEIHSESVFYDWLCEALQKRFDYVCTDTIEEFQRQPRALSKNGQIKASGGRHEKDDRHALSDRSRYVLGWDNRAKRKALEERRDVILAQLKELQNQHAELNKRRVELSRRRDQIRDLLQHTDFDEINPAPVAGEIAIWQDEKREIEKSSDLLRQLREQSEQVGADIASTEALSEKLSKEQGQLEEKQSYSRERLDAAVARMANVPPEKQKQVFPYIEGYRRRAVGDTPLSLKNLGDVLKETRDLINRRLDACLKRLGRLRDNLIRQMNDFRHAYPAESVELGADLDALPEYSERLRVLESEDLPRHEERFKAMLNQETINSIALFKNQLEKEYDDILDKIERINRSLREIEYNPGSYIVLVGERAQDAEIAEFRESLRACLAHGLNEDSLYNEQKFLQVKAIIDRFNGREGFGDLDRRWTERVTDVRNWFQFSAVERWRADDSEKEYYSDSAGKSGGQKEKLAYTILASALSFQFGLDQEQSRTRSFRFVMIDEAFGRGSDESARYGLELFKKLNLQLLIATPLQKIHVIEDYVRSVHFILNRDSKDSQIQNMSIHEYRRKKKELEDPENP